MFSSLHSLLPSSLHSHSASPGPNSTPTKAKSPPVQVEDNADENRGKKKEKKEKMANETFIFVRPPPAKSNHPLNLQLQLVPPNTRAPGVPDDEHALRRTPSDASGYSDAAASTSSFSSVSTTSTSSSRRMIVPLYNLHAHNVMTNTIVDAGTDAKVARFGKRGIEIIDLALLEPVEVWALTNTNEGSGSRFIQRPSKIGRPVTPLPGSTPTSSAVSLSLSAGDHPTVPTPIPEEITSPRKRNIFGKIFKKKDDNTLMPPPVPSKGHGRSLSTSSFLSPPGRRSTSSHRSSLVINPPPTTNASEFGEAGPTPSTATFVTTPTPSSTTSSTGQIILPATLGVYPTLSSLLPFPFPPPSSISTYPPNLRTWIRRMPETAQAISIDSIPRGPAMYVWIVRKWYKRDFQVESGFGGFAAVASKGILRSTGGPGGAGDLTSRVEVRLEWKKGKTVKRPKTNPGVKERDFAVAAGGGDSPSRRASLSSNHKGNSRAPTPTPTTHTATTATESTSSLGDDHPTLHDRSSSSKERKRRNRLSGLSHHSSRPNSVSDLGGDHGTGTVDLGEESDPEDSETPWVCTLKVRRLHSTTTTSTTNKTSPLSPQSDTAAAGGGEEPETYLKLKTATLSPTPHHPKVVAMLKVPFPLPDVSLGGDVPMAIKRNTASIPPLPPPHSNGGYEGDGDGEDQGDGGARLSAEEIKDVVCSTGFWVVVREGFGGVGRVGRKGDGWRIRA